MEKEKLFPIIIVGAYLLKQIILEILLFIYKNNSLFSYAHGWRNFTFIVAIISFVFSIVFYVMLIIYFRHDRFILVFAIVLIISNLTYSLLISIGMSSWRTESFAHFLGTLSLYLRYINMAAALSLFMDKRYNKLVPITFVVLAAYTYRFSSWYSPVFALRFFSPIIVGSYHNLLNIYLPFNNYAFFLTSIVTVLQVFAIKELLKDKTQKEIIKVHETKREQGFMDIINANNPKKN